MVKEKTLDQFECLFVNCFTDFQITLLRLNLRLWLRHKIYLIWILLKCKSEIYVKFFIQQSFSRTLRRKGEGPLSMKWIRKAKNRRKNTKGSSSTPFNTILQKLATLDLNRSQQVAVARNRYAYLIFSLNCLSLLDIWSHFNQHLLTYECNKWNRDEMSKRKKFLRSIAAYFYSTILLILRFHFQS